MKKLGIKIFTLVFALSLVNGCGDDFLKINPKGDLSQNVLANADGIDALLIGAYALLDGTAGMGFGWQAASSNWVYASIRGLVANKGTDSGDQPDINPIQTFSETATNPYLNVKWRSVYDAIQRCNSVINVTNEALEAGTIDQAQADLFVKQARALRGWFHFEAWRMWQKIPYVDETTDPATVTNTEDAFPKFIADLEAGTSLPDDMGQVGRFNGTVVKILLARAYMQNGDYAKALPLLKYAESQGTKPNGEAIGLADTYGEVFDIENRNGIEAIYTVQYSVNDGSGGWNGGWGEVLNFPYKGGASPGGCCGFFQPTQEFVNSFRTSGGLPMLDGSYNSAGEELLRDQGIPAGPVWDAENEYEKEDVVTAYDPAEPFIDRAYRAKTDNIGKDPISNPGDWELLWVEDNSKPIDPRLDWSAGRRGIPYWDWGIHTGQDWIRDQSYAGPYSPKKQVYKKSQEGTFTEVGSWTSGWTANGYRLIRYADLLLMLAECEIKVNNDLGAARIYVNMVRKRAANPDGFVKEADGVTDAANYEIDLYPSSGPPFDTKENAMKALMMERKLELGMEGHRWFDLNRWGITQQELTKALDYEKSMPWGSAMYGNATVGPEDSTYPIPQRQIDLSLGNLVQNR